MSNQTQSYGTRNDPYPGLAFYRPGEITLLLEPPGRQDSKPDALPRLTSRDLEPLRALVAGRDYARQADHQREDPFFDKPFVGTDRRQRRIHAMERGGNRGRLALQAVNLASWPGEYWPHYQEVDLAPSLKDVATVVRALNERLTDGQDIMVGDYRLKAVAPNWLAAPFWW